MKESEGAYYYATKLGFLVEGNLLCWCEQNIHGFCAPSDPSHPHLILQLSLLFFCFLCPRCPSTLPPFSSCYRVFEDQFNRVSPSSITVSINSKCVRLGSLSLFSMRLTFRLDNRVVTLRFGACSKYATFSRHL